MAQPTMQAPPGWHIAGSVRTAYVAGVDPKSPRGVLHCSFCHKGADAAKKLIVGGGSHVHICDECVALCVEIIAEQPGLAAR